MSEERTYSLNQIARELDIPASTIRYWRDYFLHFLDYVEKGNKKRFRKQTIDVFKKVKELKDQGYEFEDIENVLMNEFSINIEDVTTYEHNNERTNNKQTTSKNPDNTEVTLSENKMQAIIKQQTNMIKQLSNKMDEIKQDNQRLEEKIDDQKKYIDQKLEERDAELIKAIREKQQEQEKKPTIWQKLFGR